MAINMPALDIQDAPQQPQPEADLPGQGRQFFESYTQIPNYLIDEHFDLPPAAFKVYALILRKTVGWGKEWDEIGYSQFKGMDDRSIRNAVDKLVKAGLIFVHKRPRNERGEQPTFIYEVNLYGEPHYPGKTGGKILPYRKPTHDPSPQNADTPSPQNADTPIGKMRNTKESLKEKEKENNKGEAPVKEAQPEPANVVVDNSFFSDKAKRDLALIRVEMPGIELKKAEKLARLEKGEARIKAVAAAARKRADENPEGYFISCLEKNWKINEPGRAPGLQPGRVAPEPGPEAAKTQPTQAYLEKQARLKAQKEAEALKDEAARAERGRRCREIYDNLATQYEPYVMSQIKFTTHIYDVKRILASCDRHTPDSVIKFGEGYIEALLQEGAAI
jgi:hypothetical protein